MEKGTRFEIMSGDNTMVGYYTKPEGEGKFPAVIVSHGFSSNTDRTHPYAQIFRGEGYATFIYDFTMTGTGESSGDFAGVSALSEKEDLLVMLNYVRGLDFVDRENITLAGCSLGGFVSALAGAEAEDKVKEMVLFYPAFCMPEHLREGHVQLTEFDVNNIPDAIVTPRMTVGKKFVTDCINMDEYACTRQFSKPVLIIHGLEDRVVPIDFARKAVKGYSKGELKGIHGDHGFNDPKDFAVCQKIVKNWVNR